MFCALFLKFPFWDRIQRGKSLDPEELLQLITGCCVRNRGRQAAPFRATLMVAIPANSKGQFKVVGGSCETFVVTGSVAELGAFGWLRRQREQ
jgi:hypothetical protein